MNFASSVSCKECGSPVGTSSGRCPFCGAKLVEAPVDPSKPKEKVAAEVGYSEGALRYERFGTTKRVEKKSPKPFLLVGVGVVLLFGGLYAFFNYRGSQIAPLVEASQSPAPVKAPAPAPGEIVIVAPESTNPDDLSVPAQYRARAIDPDAKLLSVRAGPVVGDDVDLTAFDAQIVYTYLASDKEKGGGASPSRFVVTVIEGGAMQATFPATPSDAKTVVEEPLCVFSAAIRAGRASGIPEDAKITATYEYDNVLDRAVWKLDVEDQKELTRYIDGKSCAILTSR